MEMDKKSNSQETQKSLTSLIISVFNFVDSVNALYESAVHMLQKLNIPFEMVFVDDGSTDGTYEKLMVIAKQDDRVRVVKMRSTFGESAALDAGLKHSLGYRIIYLSGRVRVNPEAIPDLLGAMKEKDLIVGRRFPRRDSILNRCVSWGFNRMVSHLSKVRLHDISSGVLVTYREVLEKISFYGDLYNFIPVLAAQQGYRVGEANIEQLSGSFRTSKYPREYLRRLLDIVTVFFLARYSKKPIHFLGFFGTVFMIVGFGIELYLFIYRILGMGPIAGRPLLILGALLLVIGIQMISIGLLGEMLIFTHAGDIEEYNIEEIIN